MKKIVLIGAGGHSKVLIDTIQSMNMFDIEGIIDDSTDKMYNLNIPILGGDWMLEKIYFNGVKCASIGVGDLNIRKNIYYDLKKIGYYLPRIVHNSAVVSKYSKIGEGTCVLAKAVINADAIIGNNCIINTSSIVEHDCSIGNNTHISPGASIAGNVKIGSNTHIGIGSSIIQSICIGSNVIVGAGSVVIDDIPDNCVCVGVPAKVIKVK